MLRYGDLEEMVAKAFHATHKNGRHRQAQTFRAISSPLASSVTYVAKHVIKVNTSGENAERTNSSEGPSGNGRGKDRLNQG